MAREPIHHPIQQAIEKIWKAGHTPRIQVDARSERVVVPEFVRAKWGAHLVLDLDASWPLNIAYSEHGIEVDLAFQGIVARCTLPWTSIYVVLDRATGRGMVIEAHAPKDDAPARPAPRRKDGASTASAHAERERAAEPPAPSSDEQARARRARFRVIDGGR